MDDKHRNSQPTTFLFIGVTTRQSSIMRVFPLWMAALGRTEVAIEGRDLPPHAAPARYRQVVSQVARDPRIAGALVTTHKIDLYHAARDLFDVLDPYAQVCGEVSCISKRGGALIGHALDPIAGGLSLDALLGKQYFGADREVLCLGAGGAATAIAVHLIEKPDPADRPARMVVVNRSPGRLEGLRRMVEGTGTGIAFEYVCNEDPRHNDRLMAGLAPGSVVINATGMGKDRPGSPITDEGLFPLDGVAWELNYRGALGFLHQARAQAAARRLAVEDGWRYFLHGWTQAIAAVLHLDLDPQTFARLASVAASARTRGDDSA
ncbi:MAG: shikimate dehydrogenase [Anaerolineae bacterium]|nr:shikimate dehydrogenase [Anaerolineae bacterium]